MNSTISTFDIIVLIGYLSGMLLIGYLSGRGNKNQDDYLLAGRSMPWFPIALSVAATMISANSFIGGPGWGYNSGLSPYMVNIAVPIAIFVALTVSIPIFYNLRITSIYEYMEQRLGKRMRLLTVILFFCTNLLQVSSMVFIPALILKTITGWPLNIIVPLIVFISIIYTLLGGIKAVIWTDLVQTIVVWIGLILAFIIPVKALGGDVFSIFESAKLAGKFQTLDFTFDLHTTHAFWCSIIGGSAMWIRYFCFDQTQVQRVLTAKSIKGVKASLASSSLVMSVTYFICLLVGIVLWKYYDGIAFETTNEIMINFILTKMPVGIVGLVVAGAFAAAMSSVDSILNSMTTVFIKDIYEKHFNKDKKEVSLNKTMAISSAFGVIIIFIVIIAFGDTVKSVIDVVGGYISYFSGPALAAFVLAMFTDKANDKGTAIGLIAGFGLGYLFAKTYSISWLWNPAIGFIISFSVGYVSSLLFTSDKSIDEINLYTAKGIRKSILASDKTTVDGVSIVPFKIDKYAIFTLAVFIGQFIVLGIFQ